MVILPNKNKISQSYQTCKEDKSLKGMSHHLSLIQTQFNQYLLPRSSNKKKHKLSWVTPSNNSSKKGFMETSLTIIASEAIKNNIVTTLASLPNKTQTT